MGWQAWGPTEGVGSVDWAGPGVPTQPIRGGSQPVADAPEVARVAPDWGAKPRCPLQPVVGRPWVRSLTYSP